MAVRRYIVRGRRPAKAAAILLPLFFLSGGTALIYQTAWVRSLTLVFGASHEAVGIVLASFMGGLALGGFVFGRWAERLARPLLVYALLEAGIAAVAFVPDRRTIWPNLSAHD